MPTALIINVKKKYFEKYKKPKKRKLQTVLRSKLQKFLKFQVIMNIVIYLLFHKIISNSLIPLHYRIAIVVAV